MKKLIFITMIAFTSLYSGTLNAQMTVTLPYFTGFDDVIQKSGWIEIKKAATTFSHWEFGGYGAYSAPNYIGHGFSPSSGITLTDNWFVSPEFSISNGGKLDSIRFKSSGYSKPAAGDTIAVYLLNGSQDPSQTTKKLLLFDFRNSDFKNDDTFRIVTNIALPAFNGPSYLAIRYRNSDCSSNWLTVGFDNIAISANSSGMNDFVSDEKADVYPNPAKGKIYIRNGNSINSVEIYNLLGERVYSDEKFNAQSSNVIDISGYNTGIFFVKFYHGTKSSVRKIVVR